MKEKVVSTLKDWKLARDSEPAAYWTDFNGFRLEQGYACIIYSISKVNTTFGRKVCTLIYQFFPFPSKHLQL